MEIGERVCLGVRREVVGEKGVRKNLSSGLGSGKDKEKADDKYGEGFEIMANVVWAEFGRAIMDEMGATVFAAGRPDEFRKVPTHTLPPCSAADRE